MSLRTSNYLVTLLWEKEKKKTLPIENKIWNFYLSKSITEPVHHIIEFAHTLVNKKTLSWLLSLISLKLVTYYKHSILLDKVNTVSLWNLKVIYFVVWYVTPFWVILFLPLVILLV